MWAVGKPGFRLKLLLTLLAMLSGLMGADGVARAAAADPAHRCSGMAVAAALVADRVASAPAHVRWQQAVLPALPQSAAAVAGTILPPPVKPALHILFARARE